MLIYTTRVRTLLWPQEPSWTVRPKPGRFYSLSALGSQTPALRGSILPMASVCSSCLLAPITTSCTPLFYSRLPTQAAPRTGKSEQHRMQGCTGTRLGHHTQAMERGIHCPPQTPQRAGVHYRFSSGVSHTHPGGPGWRQLWDTPELAIPHVCFQPRKHRAHAYLGTRHSCASQHSRDSEHRGGFGG